MKPLVEKTLILGHRGASGYAPENTMEAFELAAKMGADGFELDVHLTSDGQIVICHDEKIDRTSNGQGIIPEYTFAELRAMDFGFHFYNGQRKGIRIPTLDEVYGLAKPLGLTINVEIKPSNPEIIPACYEAAKRHCMLDNVIYSSFDHFQVRRMKDMYPDTFVAPLYSVSLFNPWNICGDLDAKAIHPKYLQIPRSEDYVKHCHDRGIRVHTWTVNTEDDVQQMLDLGVDAIITNYPDIAVKLRDQKFSK